MKYPYKSSKNRSESRYNHHKRPSRLSPMDLIDSFGSKGQLKYVWMSLGGLFLAVVLGLTVLGYGGYRIAQEVTQSVARWDIPKDLLLPSLEQKLENSPRQEAVKKKGHEGNFVGEFLTSLGQGWIEGWFKEALGHAPISHVKLGLACFDAIGGPPAEVIIENMRSQMPSDRFKDKLDQIQKVFARENAPQGASACAQWILNS